MFLKVENLDAGYGKKEVLYKISLSVEQKEIVALIGPNGSGKSTLLKAIFGLLKPYRGSILFEEKNIVGRNPSEIIKMGISFVPQGGEIFPDLTVQENLELGGYILKDNLENKNRIYKVFQFFPILNDRKNYLASSLSGGEKQMLALGMALMLIPKMILLDEPSIGLSPKLVKKIMENIRELKKKTGAGILLVEQNVRQALKIADRVYILKLGRIVREITPQEFQEKGNLWEIAVTPET